MDWQQIIEYETIPGRAISRGLQWEINEIFEGNPKKNSSNTNTIKTAAAKMVALSLGYNTLLQLHEKDLPEAQKLAEEFIGKIRQGRQRRGAV